MSFKSLLSLSPIKIRRMLIYKMPMPLLLSDKDLRDDIEFIVIDQDLIDTDPWLATHRSKLSRHLRNGYKGFAGFTKDTAQCIGYSWYAVDKPPGTSIPKVPKNVVWRFNLHIRDIFRGRRYQRNFHQFCDSRNFFVNYIYSDVSPSNISSRRNLLASKAQEAGVYYILILGIRRIKWLNYRLGYWNNQEKHPSLPYV
jgi:hypothetical protein